MESIQRFHSFSALVFLAMTTTIVLSTTGEASPAGKMNSTAAEWCNLTRYPDVCNSMLTTLKNGTWEEATTLAIRVTLEKLKEGTVQLDSFLKTNGSAPLNACKVSYDSAFDELNTALQKISSDQTLVRLLFAAVTGDFETCQDEFDLFKLFNPIADINDYLKKMSGINSYLGAELAAE